MVHRLSKGFIQTGSPHIIWPANVCVNCLCSNPVRVERVMHSFLAAILLMLRWLISVILLSNGTYAHCSHRRTSIRADIGLLAGCKRRCRCWPKSPPVFFVRERRTIAVDERLPDLSVPMVTKLHNGCVTVDEDKNVFATIMDDIHSNPLPRITCFQSSFLHPASRQPTICGALMSPGRKGCWTTWPVLRWLSDYTLRRDSLMFPAFALSASRLLTWCVFLHFQSTVAQYLWWLIILFPGLIRPRVFQLAVKLAKIFEWENKSNWKV